jgi:hypothetical protein
MRLVYVHDVKKMNVKSITVTMFDITYGFCNTIPKRAIVVMMRITGKEKHEL